MTQWRTGTVTERSLTATTHYDSWMPYDGMKGGSGPSLRPSHWLVTTAAYAILSLHTHTLHTTHYTQTSVPVVTDSSPPPPWNHLPCEHHRVLPPLVDFDTSQLFIYKINGNRLSDARSWVQDQTVGAFSAWPWRWAVLHRPRCPQCVNPTEQRKMPLGPFHLSQYSTHSHTHTHTHTHTHPAYTHSVHTQEIIHDWQRVINGRSSYQGMVIT